MRNELINLDEKDQNNFKNPKDKNRESEDYFLSPVVNTVTNFKRCL